jgi:hypothetical protein
MAERNRVTPLGDIEAFPLRGAWTGNRGILHQGREIVRTHASNLWITCALEFRGRRREQWLPDRWTHLYFHDEAVALAAGHRPCGECRRAAYQAYKEAWADSGPLPSATEMNKQLHRERLVRGGRRLHPMPWHDLPDGTFVLLEDVPAVKVAGQLTVWTRKGYGTRLRLPSAGTATVLTPPSTVAVLRAGYPAQIDETARG